MKKIFHTSIIIFIVLIFSCAPKPKVKPKPTITKNPRALYAQAMKRYQADDFENSVRLFNKFVFQYPDHPRAPVVLMKLGEIHKHMGNFEKARTSYEKIVSRYSGTRFERHARVNILDIFLQEGNFQEIIARSPEIINHPKSYPPKAFLIIAEAHLKVDKPEVATKLYTIAYNMANENQRDIILQGLNESVHHIPTQKLEALIMKIPEKFPKGYFVYHLGLKYIEEKKYKQALATLINFSQKYPHHKLSEEVDQWVNILKEKSQEALFKLGVLLPLSGRYEAYGNKALAGVELALDHFSSENPDLPIKLQIRDSCSDPGEAGKAVRDLASQGATALIGPIATAESAAENAQMEKIPIITLTLKDKITEYGDYVFRNFLTAEMQVRTLISFVTEKLGLSRFAILYPDENYGIAMMNLFWDEITAHGATVVAAESYQTDETDFKVPIKKLAGLYYNIPDKYRSQTKNKKKKNELLFEPIVDFEAIFIPDTPVKSGMIIPQLAYYDIKGVYFLGTNLWHSENFIKIGHYFSKGAIFTDGFFAQSDSPEVRIFVEEFRNAYGETPGFMEAIAYDTTTMVMESLKSYDMLTRKDFRNHLMDLRFRGVTGETSFNHTGEAIKDTYLIQVEKDNFVELSRPLDESNPVRIYH